MGDDASAGYSRKIDASQTAPFDTADEIADPPTFLSVMGDVLRAAGICNAQFARAHVHGLLVGLDGPAFVVNEWLFHLLSDKAKRDLAETINCFVMGPAEAGGGTLAQIVFVGSSSREELADWTPSSGLRVRALHKRE